MAEVDPEAIFISEREEDRETFEEGIVADLFVTERTARNVFPDRFEGDLFDRDRVTEIVPASTDHGG